MKYRALHTLGKITSRLKSGESKPGMVIHVYNPSILGGGGRKTRGSKSASSTLCSRPVSTKQMEGNKERTQKHLTCELSSTSEEWNQGISQSSKTRVSLTILL